MLFNFGLDSVLLAIRENRRADFALASLLATLKDSHNGCFVLRSRSGDLSGADAFMHVPCLLSDESFIGFDVSHQHLFERSLMNSKPDTVIEKPSCLLRYADGPMDLIRTDTIL